MFYIWCCTVPTAYFVFNYVLNHSILSYNITCLLSNTYLALAGIIGWYELFGVQIEDAKADPFFGHSPYVINHLIAPLAAYQFWNSVYCIANKEMRTFETIAHHIMAFLLALCGFDSFLHYWAIYFFGITEISSVPLTMMTILKLTNNHGSAAYKWSRTGFAFTFLRFRFALWPYYYAICIYQATQYYMNGALYSPYYYIFAFGSTTLTVLQIYWGCKIVKCL